MDKIAEIEQAVGPALARNNFELIETEYLSEGGKWVLRLFIDKISEGGVTLDDCSKASDLAGDILDASGVLTGHYVLEVSSPGVNRRLKTDAHFGKAIGQNVKVSTFAPITEGSSQKNFKGVLMGFENGTLDVSDATSGRVSIPRALVAKANLDLI